MSCWHSTGMCFPFSSGAPLSIISSIPFVLLSHSFLSPVFISHPCYLNAFVTRILKTLKTGLMLAYKLVDGPLDRNKHWKFFPELLALLSALKFHMDKSPPEELRIVGVTVKNKQFSPPMEINQSSNSWRFHDLYRALQSDKLRCHFVFIRYQQQIQMIRKENMLSMNSILNVQTTSPFMELENVIT